VSSDSSHFSPLENIDCVSTPQQNHFSKSLPTPVETPTSNQFMPPGYQNASSTQENHRFSASAMRRIHSATGDDDASAFTFSGPQSVSSMSQTSPSTPHTNYDPEYDEKNFGQGENIHSAIDTWMDEYLPFDPGYPQSAAFSQAMQDVFADQSYSTSATQNFSQQSQPNMPHTSSHLSPYRNMNVFASRLLQANQEHLAKRTGSPVASVARERSPFTAYNQMQELSSEMSPRNQMTAMTQAMMEQPRVPTAPKSVSPKELMLEDPDFEETDTTPLFPTQFDQSSSFANRRQNANMSTFPDRSGLFNQQSFSAASAQVPQQYPFISERRRQQNNMQDSEADQVPDFPAHLLSMETTVEEASSSEPSSSQHTNTQQPSQQTQRPSDTSSDCGTYTCTYRGCTLRFETPAKLQKHKRESHRQNSPNAASSGPTSATAHNLGLRNSQAGPHKCERTNPSTGKPCNSIFSRPYDLTRHEDTIHNGRKQKVRCHLCTEEKTFSRNDALTRHMRVVHPDVDWPGKTRRGKGGG
jgi:Zinc finger, C2H2 type